MKRELELRVLAMCKKLLPLTTQSDNKELAKLLDDMEKELKKA